MYISILINIYNKKASYDNYRIKVNSCVKLPEHQKSVLKDLERNQAIF